jgi:hypothetical protein
MGDWWVGSWGLVDWEFGIGNSGLGFLVVLKIFVEAKLASIFDVSRNVRKSPTCVTD